MGVHQMVTEICNENDVKDEGDEDASDQIFRSDQRFTRFHFLRLGSSDDGNCRMWDAWNSHFILRIYAFPRPSDSLAGRNNGPSTISSVQSHQMFCRAFSASGTVFVTGSSDNLERVWMWNTCRPDPDDPERSNHEIEVLSGHENSAVNYVQLLLLQIWVFMTDSPKEENIPKFRNSWSTKGSPNVDSIKGGSKTAWQKF